MRNSDSDSLKKRLKARKQPEKHHSGLLSSGSTLLNLACSGKAGGAFHKGHYYNYVGHSNSGKSWAVLTSFAEAAISPEFDDYRLIFDNPENSAVMDMAKFFGPKMASRLETVHSPSVEGFYYGIDDCFKADRPFVYVLDSMDALNPEEDSERFQAKKSSFNKRTSGKNPEVSGSYGTAKAKANSTGLRLLMDPLRDTGSILIIISQSRKNLGFGSQFNPDSQSGGTALKFYAQLQIWTSIKELIKKRVKGRDRQLGIRAKIHVKKNRVTGKDRVVYVPIYHSFGMDDAGSMIDWLVEEKHWEGNEDVAEAPEFSFSGKKEGLIKQIQEGGMEGELTALVETVWDNLEKACQVERKSKYR